MDNSFNPYHEWLGLDAKLSAPDFYQLLGLENSADDAEAISAAADRAMSRVRGFKPGKNAPLWARLLDELETAKNCLVDPAAKSRYDADLAAGKTIPSPEADRHSAPSFSADLQFKPTGPSLTSLMYPPGFGDQATLPSSPLTPAPAASAAPTFQSYDPMAPVSPAAYAAPISMPAPYAAPFAAAVPNPMAPVATAPMMAAPVAAAPTRPYGTAYDPMAPIAMPVASYAPVASAYSPAMTHANPMAPLAAPMMTGMPVAGYAAVPSAGPVAVPVAQLVAPADFAHGPVAVGVPIGVGSAYPTAHAAPLLAAAPTPTAAQPASKPAVRSQSVRSQLSAERTRTSTQTPIILGVGGGLILLTVAIIYATVGGKNKSTNTALNAPSKTTSTIKHQDVSQNSTPKQTTPSPIVRNPATPKSNPVTVTNIPVPPDETMPGEDSPRSRPKPNRPQDRPEMNPEDPSTPRNKTPEPKPEPKPEPTPEPKPAEPTPPPTPEKPTPEKPEAVPAAQPKPTKEQVHTLAEALKNARAALGDVDTEEASRLLASVEALPKLPDHQAKYQRLKQLAHYVHEFQMGYQEALKGMESGAIIQVGNTVVAVVELFPGQDKVILRVSGTNRTYRLRELPVGLAVAIADRWLNKTDGATYLVKGAFVFVHRKRSDEMIKKGREWWGQAEREIPDIVKNLRPVLDDTYDLEKDLPAEPPAS